MRRIDMARADLQPPQWDALLQFAAAAQLIHFGPGGPRSPDLLADPGSFERTTTSASRGTVQRLIHSGGCYARGIPVNLLAVTAWSVARTELEIMSGPPYLLGVGLALEDTLAFGQAA